MPDRICIAQIKVYPQKGDLDANHAQLMSTLDQIQDTVPKPDVVITPECFLDGYVVTEKYVTAENIARYAIDPYRSRYLRKVSEWAADNYTWFILGCTRLAPESSSAPAIACPCSSLTLAHLAS